MALVHWQLLQPMGCLYQEIHRLVHDLLTTSCQSTLWFTESGTTGISAIELHKMDREIVLKVQISDVVVDTLEIQVNPETVLIRGEQTETAEVQGYFNSKFYVGRFQSLIPLPNAVRPETVRAKLEDGVLTLTLQKSRETPKQTVRFNLGSVESILTTP